MPIALYRIDDRLIHGQVVVGWGQPLELAFIVLIDDEVAMSEWEQELYRMGVPPEMEVHFHDVATGATLLPRYEADARPGIVLVGDIRTMQRLVEAAPIIREVNVGGVHHAPGRVGRLRYVFLNAAEEDMLRTIERRGVTVTAQDVPATRAMPLNELLEKSARQLMTNVFGDFLQPLDLLPMALLGGVLGLDVVSFPQAMLSRPIVAATVSGALAGNAMAGLICGAVLECLAVESLPVGASRYPEWGSASTVAGVLAAQGESATTPHGAGALVVAVAMGIFTAWVGGWTMVRHRRLVASWARPRLDQLAAGSTRTVVGLQVFGMTVDLLRGALLTVILLVPSLFIEAWVEDRWTLSAEITRATVVTIAAAVAAAAVWKDFHTIPGTRRLFLAALAVGTVAVVMRG